MFNFLLYASNVLCSSGQSALGKLYGKRNGNSVNFNLSKSLAAVVLFIVFSIFSGFSFHQPTIIFGFFYGLSLLVSMYCGFAALACGPMAITSVIASFSLIIPYIFGIAVFGEPAKITGICGIVLIAAALMLMNFRKPENLSARWWILSLMTFLTNGICSVLQKYHQICFPGKYSTEFMLSAMAVVLIILSAVSLAKKDGGKIDFTALGFASGVLNALANYLTIYLSATENASTLFPIISVANAIASWCFGRFAFGEKLRRTQLFGLALGIVSVLLMKI